MGRLSDLLGSLPAALRCMLVANALAAVLLGGALRHLERDELSVRERARAAGEPC